MAFDKLTENLSIISALPEKPNASAGYTAAEVQAAFDTAGLKIQNYINNTLLEQLKTGGASRIGIDTISGLTATSIQTALEAIVEIARQAQVGAIVAGSVIGSAVLGATSKIREGSIGASDIHDGEITTAKMASTFTVQGSQVQNLSINKSQINNFSVAFSELPSIPLGDEKVTGTLTPAKGGTGQTSLESTRQAMNAAKVTTTTVSIPTTAWNNKVATVSVTGITSGGTVIVTASPSTRSYWVDADVYCSGQATDQLTFTCATVPTASVTANVMVIT